MQGVRRQLLHVQADTVGLPVWEVPLPSPCPNDEYERRMSATMERAVEEGITHIALGGGADGPDGDQPVVSNLVWGERNRSSG